MKDNLQLTDVSTAEGQMVSIDLKDIPELPVDMATMPWKPFTEEQKAETACILDDVCVLNIPKPKSKEEEEELVNKFLTGLRKLFSKKATGPSCHAGNQHGPTAPSATPALRPVIFMRCRAKTKCTAQLPLRDLSPHLQAVCEEGAPGQVALRRHAPQLEDRGAPGRAGLPLQPLPPLCPDLPHRRGQRPAGREIRKLFSQEMGIYPKELHEKGTMNQMKCGSSTGMTPEVVKDNVEFIDEDYTEITGVGIHTPFDVKGADIMLLHNAGEIMAWPENIAAFSLIFQEAGLSWTLSSHAMAYDGVNYGVFYDDAQTARIALQHMMAAKELGVKKIVIGECGHAHKALTVIADRVIPFEYQVPRESCYVTLRDIVMSGRLKLDPARNDFPVTLHDPCNIVRLMGIVEPQREILRKIAPQFREMPCHGVDNYCCGGGSGFAIMTRNNIEQWRGNISGRKKMWQISEAFKDCLGPETKKYICAPCSNCKGQIREILEHNDLYTKNNFAYGGLVELIVNAMTNVNPGYIKFEGAEEEAEA